MRCLSEDTLLAYLSNELPYAERYLAESHLAGCDECRSSLGRLKQQLQDISSAVALMEPPDTDEARRADFAYCTDRAEQPAARREVPEHSRFRFRRLLSLAFAPAAVLLLAFLLMRSTDSPVTPHDMFDPVAFEEQIMSNPLRQWQNRQLVLHICDAEGTECRTVVTSFDRSRAASETHNHN